MDIATRLKNYGLWTSIAAFAPIILQVFGIDLVPEKYNELVNALLSIMVILGIVNNPTTENKGFLDDTSQK